MHCQREWRRRFWGRTFAGLATDPAPRGLVRLFPLTAVGQAPAKPQCSSGLGATVEHLVVRRALVEVREHRSCLRRHVGDLIVLACERLH